MGAPMPLEEVEKWLEKEIGEQDAVSEKLVRKAGSIELRVGIHLARARIIAKLADVRIARALVKNEKGGD